MGRVEHNTKCALAYNYRVLKTRLIIGGGKCGIRSNEAVVEVDELPYYDRKACSCPKYANIFSKPLSDLGLINIALMLNEIYQFTGFN